MLRGRRIKNPQPTALGVHQLVLVGEVRVVELLLQVVHSVFVKNGQPDSRFNRHCEPRASVYFRCLQYPFDASTGDLVAKSTSLKLLLLPHPKILSNSGNSRLF